MVETGAWILLTFFMFMFADFVPKTLARLHPQRIAISIEAR
jgi:Mg2+/Co2+ transporter CorB